MNKLQLIKERINVLLRLHDKNCMDKQVNELYEELINEFVEELDNQEYKYIIENKLDNNIYVCIEDCSTVIIDKDLKLWVHNPFVEDFMEFDFSKFKHYDKLKQEIKEKFKPKDLESIKRKMIIARKQFKNAWKLYNKILKELNVSDDENKISDALIHGADFKEVLDNLK